MKHAVFVLIVGAALLFGHPAVSDPELRLSYPGGIAHVEIGGSYPFSHYRVWRATSAGDFSPITDADVLCTGSCFADDFGAEPGATYLYRFDLATPQGDLVRFGPYLVTISPRLVHRIAAQVSPNPSAGAVVVELFLAGVPGATRTNVEASLFDLQGRRVSTIHRGPLANGLTRVSWSGRGDDGRTLRAGAYFLRFSAADGRVSVARVLRAR